MHPRHLQLLQTGFCIILELAFHHARHGRKKNSGEWQDGKVILQLEILFILLYLHSFSYSYSFSSFHAFAYVGKDIYFRLPHRSAYHDDLSVSAVLVLRWNVRLQTVYKIGYPA